MRISAVLLTILVLASLPAAAGPIVGLVQLMAGSPGPGLQQISVLNMTGDCPNTEACAQIFFIDWTLTINYTDLTVETVTKDNIAGTDDDAIGPTFPGALVDLLMTSQINSLVFAGTFSPATTLLNDGITTFMAEPNLSVTLPVGPEYVENPLNPGETPVVFADILMDEATADVPEPVSGLLVAAALGCLILVRRRRSQRA